MSYRLADAILHLVNALEQSGVDTKGLQVSLPRDAAMTCLAQAKLDMPNAIRFEGREDDVRWPAVVVVAGVPIVARAD